MLSCYVQWSGKASVTIWALENGVKINFLEFDFSFVVSARNLVPVSDLDKCGMWQSPSTVKALDQAMHSVWCASI